MDSRTCDGTVGVFGHYGNHNLGDEAIIAAVVAYFSRHHSRIRLLAFSMDPADSAERHQVPAYPIRRNARNGPAVPGTKPGVVRYPPVKPADTAARNVSTERGTGLKASVRRMPLLRKAYVAARRSVRSLTGFAAELAFLWRSFRRVRRLDLLLITGSNQLFDYFGGPWGYPYTLLKWTVLARLAGVPVAFASMGAGPLDHPLSKAMVRFALRFATYVSYRDESSRQLVEGNERSSASSVYPDLAHALPVEMTKRSAPPPKPGSPLTVAINVMPVYDRRYWPVESQRHYSAYVETMGEFTRRVMAAGHKPFFFATQPSDERVIDDVLASLRSVLPLDSEAERAMVRYSRELPELIEIIQSADVVVATRFHGTLLALVCERAVLAVCYYRKTADLMWEMGQQRHSVTLEEADPDDLFRRFEALALETEGVVERTARIDAEYRASLESQFDELVGRMRTATRAVSGAGG